MIQITVVCSFIIYNVLEEKKMKKLFIPIISLLAVASLVGCNNKEEVVDYSDLKIACPSGAPALTLYDIYNKENVEINADANNIAAYMSPTSDKDIIIAPTNLIVGKVMKANAPFKLAAVVTAGNFYLASTGLDDNDTFDKDDYVVLFQQNSLPDKLFQHLYGTDFTNLHYVTAASDAAKCLISGKNEADNKATVEYVLVPQPALTPALVKAKENRADIADKIKVAKNLQNDYLEKNPGQSITQASIFVKDTNDEAKIKKVNKFLEDVSTKVNGLVDGTTNLDDYLSSLSDTELTSKFGAPNLTVLKKVVKENSLNLCYKVGKDNKASIDGFLKNLGFTSEETSEGLYW